MSTDKNTNDPFAATDTKYDAADGANGDNYLFDDLDDLNQQSSITPDIGTMATTGTAKLLVVVFVVDCSTTMAGDRIGAVNAALQELKYKLTEIKKDNGLDLRLAIMSFTSNAKWDVKLTDIEEVNIEQLHTRPGLTEYGTAFHELNKVLRKDGFMKHTGKVAPPAIMFLTDGEPTDDYAYDLDELLKNGWFANASRSAVLLGDAISNDSARAAVSRFVSDASTDIVTAEDSTVIMQKINLATMHTVAGNPMTGNDPVVNMVDPDFKNKPNPVDPVNPTPDPVNPIPDPAGGKTDPKDPFRDDPFGGSGASGGTDPFGGAGAGGTDPFGTAGAGGTDPFGTAGAGGGTDPFGAAGAGGDADPFGGAGAGGSTDPFGTAGAGDGTDPFAGMGPL